MSDTWYRDPDPIPPYGDGSGRLWNLRGEQIGGPVDEPWPDSDLPAFAEALAFRADVRCDFVEAYEVELFGDLREHPTGRYRRDVLGEWPQDGESGS